MQDAKINILLVDDDARNLDVLESVLHDASYRLLRAHDADLALRLLLEHDVAAIVLDIKMPGVSGIELARLIKGSKKFREIPIVFLTAYLVEEQDVLTGYGTGAVDYLTKPVNPLILRHKVAVFAELFRKTRALAELNGRLEVRVQERTAELERSESALRAASEQKDRFLATLAHELRNPLAPLRTGLELLLGHPDRSASMQRTLETMDRQLDHMVSLLDDLLDIARITQGTLQVRKEATELPELLQRAVEMTELRFKRRGQSVVVDPGEGPLPVQVDPTRITQIIANLLDNASKHSPDGARVLVRARGSRDGVVVQIVDQGDGILPGQLPRIFEMFTKLDGKKCAPDEGLGIGLALSRHLAELHRGTLTAQSEGRGKGATFTLTLPAQAVDASTAGAPRSGARPDAHAPPGRLRVVVVEDNDDSAELLTEWLQALGHEVALARTGLDGVALIKQEAPDLVLCDVGLPELTGLEVCRRVVADMSAPPVMVALTGWGTEEDRKGTADAGFGYHLVKPVGAKELESILATVGAGR